MGEKTGETKLMVDCVYGTDIFLQNMFQTEENHAC